MGSDARATSPMEQSRARHRRQVLVVVAAVAVAGAGVLTTVVLTRQHTFVVSGNIGVGDVDEWDPAGTGRCLPSGPAAGLAGTTLEAVTPDGDVVFRHVLADFRQVQTSCVSLFHNVEFPDVAQRYMMRLSGREVGVLTRADLVRATSPDAHPGIGFLVVDCATGSRLTIPPNPYAS
ncbi:hypothetical protein ACXR2U_11915 [Jatrophihabitans sp. YIM 134969]